MLFLSGIYHSFRREVEEIANNKLYLTSLIILPLIMLLLFTLMFSHGSIEQLPIVVVDNDHSSMSRQLISMMQATQGVGDITETQSIIDANNLVRRGDVRAMVVIPENFEHNIVSSKITSVEVSLSGANLSTAGILQRDIQKVVRSLSSGIAISKMQSMGASVDQALANVMPINVQIHTISNPYMNYGYYLAPMFIFVGIALFVTLNTIYSIGRELRYATAGEWLKCASGSLLAAIIGKLLPITIAMMIMMGLAFIILFVVMGMETMCSWTTLGISSLLLIIAYQSIATLIIAVTANLRLALSLGGGYAVMAFTFSGITFPTISMYGIAQFIAKLFPLTYFSDIFITQAVRGASLNYSLDSLVWLLGFSILGVIVWQHLSMVVRMEQYWNRD